MLSAARGSTTLFEFARRIRHDRLESLFDRPCSTIEFRGMGRSSSSPLLWLLVFGVSRAADLPRFTEHVVTVPSSLGISARQRGSEQRREKDLIAVDEAATELAWFEYIRPGSDTCWPLTSPAPSERRLLGHRRRRDSGDRVGLPIRFAARPEEERGWHVALAQERARCPAAADGEIDPRSDGFRVRWIDFEGNGQEESCWSIRWSASVSRRRKAIACRSLSARRWKRETISRGRAASCARFIGKLGRRSAAGAAHGLFLGLYASVRRCPLAGDPPQLERSPAVAQCGSSEVRLGTAGRDRSWPPSSHGMATRSSSICRAVGDGFAP